MTQFFNEAFIRIEFSQAGELGVKEVRFQVISPCLFVGQSRTATPTPSPASKHHNSFSCEVQKQHQKLSALSCVAVSSLAHNGLLNSTPAFRKSFKSSLSPPSESSLFLSSSTLSSGLSLPSFYILTQPSLPPLSCPIPSACVMLWTQTTSPSST